MFLTREASGACTKQKDTCQSDRKNRELQGTATGEAGKLRKPKETMDTKQSGPILCKSTEPSDKGALWVQGQGTSHHRPSPRVAATQGCSGRWESGPRCPWSRRTAPAGRA